MEECMGIGRKTEKTIAGIGRTDDIEGRREDHKATDMKVQTM